MTVSDAKRLKELIAENTRLKKLLAESVLENEVTRRRVAKKVVTAPARRVLVRDYDRAGGERAARARAGAHECLVAAIHPGAGYQRGVAMPAS